MFMTCLFHYNLSVAEFMRYVDNNYTASYCKIEESMEQMRGRVDNELLTHCTRVMTVGAPAYFVYETTQENAMLH